MISWIMILIAKKLMHKDNHAANLLFNADTGEIVDIEIVNDNHIPYMGGGYTF